MRRNTVSVQTLTGLDHQRSRFVIEYIKDYNAPRAAVTAGFGSDYGYKLRDEPEIAAAIMRITTELLDAAQIDAQWALMEAVDNHLIARQMGNITASNTALKMIMQHAAVDAFAAEKVEIAGDKEIMERLVRARRRRQEQHQDDGEIQELGGDDDQEVSFF